MNYAEQLNHPEWHKKRLEIFSRDQYKCIKCGILRPPILGIDKELGILSYNQLPQAGLIMIDADKSNMLFLYSGWAHSLSNSSEGLMEFEIHELCYARVYEDNQWLVVAFPNNLFDGCSLIDLNVHHTYYIDGNLAWEYENDALITLCEDCHKKEHEKTKIAVYDRKREFSKYADICSKCNGSGNLPEYNHVQKGVCFSCSGHGCVF